MRTLLTPWRRLAGLALAGAASLAFVAVAAPAQPVVAKTLDVFVDPASSFVFVKMPHGWTFVGRLDEASLRRLPAGVHTSLLPHDDGRAKADPTPARPSVLGVR